MSEIDRRVYPDGIFKETSVDWDNVDSHWLMRTCENRDVCITNKNNSLPNGWKC